MRKKIFFIIIFVIVVIIATILIINIDHQIQTEILRDEIIEMQKGMKP